MKKMFGLGLAVFAMATMAFGRVGPVSQYGQLQAGKNTSGKGQIYGACKGATSGNEVQVQGMSLFWSGAGEGAGADFWTDDIVSGLVEKQGIQLIRGPMSVDETGWNGSDHYFKNETYYQGVMDRVVQSAINNDIYVLIDFHSHCAEQSTENAVKFFSRMAEKWGKYDNVIFEIYNEPKTNCADSWPGQDGAKDYWNKTLKSYSETVISAIRKYSDNLIVVGTPYFDQYPNAAVGNALSDKNVAYSFHYYAGEDPYRHKITDQGANAVAAMNGGLSVFVTEWGNSAPSGDGGYNSSYSTEWYNWMKQHKLSGANWAVTNKAETASYFTTSGAWTYSTSGTWVNTNVFAGLPKSYTACSGSGAVSSSSTASSSSAALPAGYTDYIDDFEDGDSLTFTGGIWYAYTDKDDLGGSTITNTPNKDSKGVAGYDVVITGDNGTKGMGAITGIKLVQGENKYEPYVALGLKLNADEAAYDLSSCKTISYKYKGAAHNFKVEDTAVGDYAFHQLSKVAATSWTQVNVPWDMLVQPSWTKDEVTLSPKRIAKFTWEVKGDLKGTQPSPNYLDIDDVRCDGLAIKPTVAKPASSSSSAKSSSSSAIRSSSSIASSSSVRSSSSVAVSSSSVVRSSSSVAAGMKVTGNLTQTVAKDSPFGTITITGVNSFNRDSWNLSFLTIENKNGTVTVAGTVPSWANSGSETLTINGEKVVIKLTVAEAGTVSSSSQVVVSSSSAEKPASSSAVNPVSSSSVPTVAAPAGMVDDFEDGDNQAYTSGYWFAYNDKGDKGASTFANEEDAENGGYVVIFPATNGSTTMGGLKDIVLDQGDNEYDPYVALGLNLGEEDEAYDLSSCREISYDYIGAAHNFKVVLAGDGKGAVTGYNRHTVAEPASNTWTKATIAWDDLEQAAGWGEPADLEKSLVSAFHWEVKGEAAVPNYLYVDNFKCDGLKIEVPESSSSSTVKPGSSSSVRPQAIAESTMRMNLSVSLQGRTLQVVGADLMNVDVFDMQGRPIKSLRNVLNEVALDALANGNYIVRVRAGSANMTKRIMLK